MLHMHIQRVNCSGQAWLHPYTTVPPSPFFRREEVPGGGAGGCTHGTCVSHPRGHRPRMHAKQRRDARSDMPVLVIAGLRGMFNQRMARLRHPGPPDSSRNQRLLDIHAMGREKRGALVFQLLRLFCCCLRGLGVCCVFRAGCSPRFLGVPWNDGVRFSVERECPD